MRQACSFVVEAHVEAFQNRLSPKKYDLLSQAVRLIEESGKGPQTQELEALLKQIGALKLD